MGAISWLKKRKAHGHFCGGEQRINLLPALSASLLFPMCSLLWLPRGVWGCRCPMAYPSFLLVPL